MPTQDSVKRNWRPSHSMYAPSPPVSTPMHLTTIAGNFLRPAPLQHHKYYPWNRGKLLFRKLGFQPTVVGCHVIRGRWDSYQQTDPHVLIGLGGLFSRKKPEINLKTRRGSPHKLGGACFLSEEAHMSHLWAIRLGLGDPHLSGWNWGDGVRDTGSWDDPGVVPVFWNKRWWVLASVTSSSAKNK